MKHSASGESGKTSAQMGYDSSTNKYPSRTAYAQSECQKVVDVANSLGYPNHPVVSVFTHEDGTVSVGFSGKSNTSSSKNYAEALNDW